MIRVAEADDLAGVYEMLRDFHTESSFSHVSFDPDTLCRNLTKALGHPSFCALVAERERTPVGFLLGRRGQYFFSTEHAAWEEFIYVAPSARGTPAGRGLVRHFVAWARERGVSNIHLGINAGIDARRSGLFMEKLGFEKTGEVFALRVKSSG